MVDHEELPEAAAQWDDMTEKEREVADILLNLPELIDNLSVYGEDQLLPWGWKKRRSAVNCPLTPLPSPADSSPSPSSSSSPPRELKISKPRVAHTKEQLLQQINKLTRRRKVYQQELLKVQSHFEKQIEVNNTLKELAYRD
ncbi:hypothetical protein K7X08_014803 [Anisodus acutangulus]|uniref:Uncharacterized protein n=1 Tax=Anisodus acutangulus TaxID=402998 RepID=A0A9Q1LJ75_9SOLA|nr:hypothetical protein K7X08_014803 [Anisodus acutangulus]